MPENSFEQRKILQASSVPTDLIDLSAFSMGNSQDAALRTSCMIRILNDPNVQDEQLISIVQNRERPSTENEDILALSDCIKIYIPHGHDSSTTLLNLGQIQCAITWLTDLFGGATAFDGVGSWKGRSGETVEEPCTIVVAYAKAGEITSKAAEIAAFVNQLGVTMGQEAMAYELNNKMVILS